MRKNTVRMDPTRTTMLRERVRKDMSKRFLALEREILKLVVVDDAFGLMPDTLTVFNEEGVEKALVENSWRWLTSNEKLKQFQQWLQTKIKRVVLEEEEKAGEEYWLQYVVDAFRRGAGRSYDDYKRSSLYKNAQGMLSSWYQGTRDQFLSSSFAMPQTIEKVKLLASRIYTDLKGVTDSMATKMSRTLVDGFARGESPRVIARELNKDVKNIGRRRAETIARTEVNRAYNEGQLNSMKQLGVTKVGVMVEWSYTTLPDGTPEENVCPLCQELGGIVLSIDEASGWLPRHPNCRCAWLPANVGEDTEEQLRSQSQIQKARDKSLLSGVSKLKRKTMTIEEIRESSSWAGASTKVSKVRPRSVLD